MDEWNEEEDERFLTNMESRWKELVLRAAKETGFYIFVSDEATTASGSPLPGHIAVYTNERGRDHGPFWRWFKALEAEAPHA